jgi:PadR family transcriptional regulator, regulatory protein PadR
LGRNGLGQFEIAVLLAVHRLHGAGYAVPIEADVRVRTGRHVTPGAIYVTLDRLEKKGLVTSRLGDPTPQRGGRPKRMYRILAPGVAALSIARDAGKRMWAGAPPLGMPA